MDIAELFLTAVALSMDAFAVAICKGLSMKKVTLKKAAIVGLYFGVFQALMPLIGYFVGIQFESVIVSIDHWLAFLLLGVIGFNMVRSSFQKDDEMDDKEDISFKAMLPLAVATSIDALAVGVTFAFLGTDIVPAISVIGITTMLLSMIGVKISSMLGEKFKSRAELLGGCILILIGTKILIEHLVG